MSWDYKNITGDFWNNKPHDEQLALLKAHYPIGYMYHHIQPHNSIPASRVYSSNYICEIIGYELVGKNSDVIKILAGEGGWYNLRVRNIGQEFIQMRRYEYETIHIGFFYPDKEFFRNKQLELIIE